MPGSLTRDEIVSRVALYSTALVDELYAIAKARLEEEEHRNESLRARATALLSAAGLSITLALTFVGLLLQNAEYLRSRGVLFTLAAVAAFAFTFGAGIYAVLTALKVIAVRGDYEQPNEHEIFKTAELAAADRMVEPYGTEMPPPPDGEPAVAWKEQSRNTSRECSRAEEEKLAAAKYKRFLIAHLWSIASKHSKIHEEKAEWLRIAQRRFVWFLIAFTGTVGIMAAGVVVQQLQGGGPATITCKIPVVPAGPDAMAAAVPDSRAASKLGAAPEPVCMP